jgi:hypothetical protein
MMLENHCTFVQYQQLSQFFAIYTVHSVQKILIIMTYLHCAGKAILPMVAQELKIFLGCGRSRANFVFFHGFGGETLSGSGSSVGTAVRLGSEKRQSTGFNCLPTAHHAGPSLKVGWVLTILAFSVKGQCHKIFCFRFFHESSSHENNMRSFHFF